MDPIQRKIVPDTQAPTNDATQVGGPTKKFDIGSTGATTGTGGSQGIVSGKDWREGQARSWGNDV